MNVPDGAWQAVNALSGAALGASFYIMLRTQPYLVARSFDPKYNAAYISRFITGVIGGIILATAIGPALGNKIGNGGPAELLTPGVLAILGGFAAEAVELILQRLVEILLAVVRGDGSAQAASKAATEQAERSVKVQELLPELEAARQDPDPAKFKASLDKVRAVLKQTGKS